MSFYVIRQKKKFDDANKARGAKKNHEEEEKTTNVTCMQIVQHSLSQTSSIHLIYVKNYFLIKKL